MRTTRRYFGCCTSRCTSTTIVFSIFALVTLPVSTVRSPRSAAAALCVSVVITPSLPFAAAEQPTVPGRATTFSPAPDLSSLRAAASALPLARWKAGTAAGKSAPSNPCAAPATLPCPLRGSSQFAAASLKPSCAGNEFRRDRQLMCRQTHGFFCCRFVHARHLEHDAPRLHTATHFSGAPLPLPMRVSAGFLVNGLSGKIRIHNFPPRLMNRVIATRDASICRSVIHAHSMAFNPYSPNAKSPPRQALPLRRPRICFLYFTFFGINIAVFSLP